jgi:Fic family protein
MRSALRQARSASWSRFWAPTLRALIREPLLVVSPWFEERRDQYQDALLQLSLNGDWDAWIAFFAEGVAASAAESQRKVERLVDLQEELRSFVQAAGKRGVAERLAADLVGWPYVTLREVMEEYELSKQGASNAIKTLLDLGILEPSGLRPAGNARLYVAPTVVEVVSS